MAPLQPPPRVLAEASPPWGLVAAPPPRGTQLLPRGLGGGTSAIGRVDVQIDGDEGLPQGASSTAPAMFNCNGDVRYYREGDEGYVPRFDMADDQFYGLDMNGDSSRFLGRGHSHSRGRSNGHTHARQASSVVARVRGRGRGRGMNICHTANATMVNGLTSQRSAKNPVDSQVQTFLLTPCPYKFVMIYMFLITNACCYVLLAINILWITLCFQLLRAVLWIGQFLSMFP
jgi:hypothetical protein